MFSLGYDCPRSATEFVEAYRKASGSSTPTLIEVRTERQENTQLHRELLSKVSEVTR